MKLRLSALTPFLLGAIARGQIARDTPTTALSAKDLASLPKPDAAPLPVVPCVGALKEDYDLYLEEYPEKTYEEEVS